MIDFLREEQVKPEIIEGILKFREEHSVTDEMCARIPKPKYLYYGKEVWEEAAVALLCGKNLLLTGPKATGKNLLAENLAAVFARPLFDISFALFIC